MFFFFKQKTAYEMRISDWSSDVCSSDLGPLAETVAPPAGRLFPCAHEPGRCDLPSMQNPSKDMDAPCFLGDRRTALLPATARLIGACHARASRRATTSPYVKHNRYCFTLRHGFPSGNPRAAGKLRRLHTAREMRAAKNTKTGGTA